MNNRTSIIIESYKWGLNLILNCTNTDRTECSDKINSMYSFNEDIELKDGYIHNIM